MPENPTSKAAIPLRIFVAEDDREMRRLIAESLRRDGEFVIEACDGVALADDLRHAFYGDEPDGAGSLIIADVRMPGAGGLEVLRSMRGLPWCPPFILITAFGDPSLHEEARELGAYAVLDKPFDVAELRAAVRRFGRPEASTPDPPLV